METIFKEDSASCFEKNLGNIVFFWIPTIDIAKNCATISANKLAHYGYLLSLSKSGTSQSQNDNNDLDYTAEIFLLSNVFLEYQDSESWSLTWTGILITNTQAPRLSKKNLHSRLKQALIKVKIHWNYAERRNDAILYSEQKFPINDECN